MIGPVYSDIRKAVQAETSRAKAAFGDTYASPHEAWGVLMEEWDEAFEEVEQAGDRMRCIALDIRNPGDGLAMTLDGIRYHAMLAACELIQVAAVCEKALGTLQKQGVVQLAEHHE